MQSRCCVVVWLEEVDAETSCSSGSEKEAGSGRRGAASDEPGSAIISSAVFHESRSPFPTQCAGGLWA